MANSGKDLEVLWAEFDTGSFPNGVPAVSRGVTNVTRLGWGYVIKFRREVRSCAVILNPSWVNNYYPREAGELRTLHNIDWEREDVGADELAVSAYESITPPGTTYRQTTMIPHTLVLFCPVRAQ